MTERVDIITNSGVMLFSHEELSCKATGRVRLAKGFADFLMGLRLAYAMPLIVTSCCRSIEHNQRIGGHPSSLHIYDVPQRPIDKPLDGCAAIDVQTISNAALPLLVGLAIERGWSVGVARGFIHLDRRDLAGLPQRVFGYGP